jgi:hypothetical protein
LAQDLTNDVMLERALRDLIRIEEEAARAGGDFSVLACLVDMAADEVREQLDMRKRETRKPLKEPLAEVRQEWSALS